MQCSLLKFSVVQGYSFTNTNTVLSTVFHTSLQFSIHYYCFPYITTVFHTTLQFSIHYYSFPCITTVQLWELQFHLSAASDCARPNPSLEHNAALCFIVLHCTLLHFTCTALYYTTQHCTTLCCTVLHCIARFCTSPHCIVLHSTALHII